MKPLHLTLLPTPLFISSAYGQHNKASLIFEQYVMALNDPIVNALSIEDVRERLIDDSPFS